VAPKVVSSFAAVIIPDWALEPGYFSLELVITAKVGPGGVDHVSVMVIAIVLSVMVMLVGAAIGEFVR